MSFWHAFFAGRFCLFSYNFVIDLDSVLFCCLFLHEIDYPESLEGNMGQSESSNFTEFLFLLFSCSNKIGGSMLSQISWLYSLPHSCLGLVLSLSLLYLSCPISILLQVLSSQHGLLSWQRALTDGRLGSSQGLESSIYFRPSCRLLALTHDWIR